MLKSNLGGYNNAYILLRVDTTILGHNAVFKNCALFTKCITKIDGATIDDAKDLDLVMLICDLLAYSSNCSVTTGSSWFFYSKDEETDFDSDIANGNNFFKRLSY